MQEFSSVTASSYDAESLAPMLTEKAGEGWSVVSIVSAGTNVVAYLTRDGDTADAASSPAEGAGISEIEVNQEAAAAVAAEATAISPSLPGDDAPAAPPAATSSPEAVAAVEASGEPSGWGAVADTPTAPDTPSVPDTASAFESADDFAADTAGDAADSSGGLFGGAADAVEGAAEHAGAIATDTMDGAADSGGGLTDSIGDATSGAADAATDTGTDDTGTDDTGTDDNTGADDTGAADTGAADTGAADTGADETAADDAGTASGVPAGWYADPSGRFELRYWDGTAWTEHVSRAGQQYTDPPVA